MTKQQKLAIENMRAEGKGYKAIASALTLPTNTIKSYCRRNNLKTATVILPKCEDDKTYCKQCGSMIVQEAKKKTRKFCKKSCCAAWWANNGDNSKRKANYTSTCLRCRMNFTAYGNKNRKYCSHACYISDRFKKAVGV